MRFLVRLLSVLCGLAVAAAGSALLIGVTWTWLLPGDSSLRPILDRLRSVVAERAWSSTPVLLTAALALAVGLLLLVVAVSAGRKDITLHSPAPGVTVTTSPRSLARLVGHRVRAADGVSTAVVTASTKAVRIKAGTRLTSASSLQPALHELATGTVGDLPMDRTPRVSVTVNSARDNR